MLFQHEFPSLCLLPFRPFLLLLSFGVLSLSLSLSLPLFSYIDIRGSLSVHFARPQKKTFSIFRRNYCFPGFSIDVRDEGERLGRQRDFIIVIVVDARLKVQLTGHIENLTRNSPNASSVRIYLGKYARNIPMNFQRSCFILHLAVGFCIPCSNED